MKPSHEQVQGVSVSKSRAFKQGMEREKIAYSRKQKMAKKMK